MSDIKPDPILEISDTPNLKALNDEWILHASASGQHLKHDDNIRFARWSGQSDDCRKHKSKIGKEPVPWEGAWDGRWPLADETIDDLVDILLVANLRAQVKCLPTGAEDIPAADWIGKVLRHYLKVCRRNLRDETELFAEFAATHGAALCHVAWQTKTKRKWQRITMDQIAQLAAQAGQAGGADPRASILAALPAMIMDPAQTGAVLDLISPLYPTVRPKHLRKAITALRTEGEAWIPIPTVVSRRPVVTALRLGQDVFLPHHTADPANARWIIQRQFLSETDIRLRQATEQWDKDWCDLIIAQACDKISTTDPQTFNPAESAELPKHYEILWFYRRQADEDGIPQITLTVYCPSLFVDPTGKEICAWHGAVEDLDGEYAYSEWRWERKARRFLQSRGIPRLIRTQQSALKACNDMLLDRSNLETVPPFLAQVGRVPFRIAPGQGIPVTRQGEISYLETPTGSPQLAIDLSQFLYLWAAKRFGLPTPESHPARWQTKIARLVNSFLGSIENLYLLLLRVIFANAAPEELLRIAGPPPPNLDPNEIVEQWDFSLNFDARELDPEQLFAKLDAIAKGILPIDAAGVIDRAKLVSLALRALDPALAEELVQNQAGANQVMFKEVRENFAQMALGNKAMFTENDPAAAVKLNMAKQVFGMNPNYQELFKSNAGFGKLVEEYLANLNMSVTQQKNKTIGRLGVDPGPTTI